MKKIAILYDLFYDFNTNSITIGGIQTYITDLINVAKSIGYQITLFQMGETTNEVQLPEYKIIAIPTKKRSKFCNLISQVIDDDTLVIFATDLIIPHKNPFKTSIAIQHGICWDIPTEKNRNILVMNLSKLVRNARIVDRVSNVKEVICVDYNFVNWYRTCVDKPNIKFTVIPNYTRIVPVHKKDNDTIRIIFARRMWWYRGTRVFTNAILRILKDYHNIEVTVAGSGPDLDYMKERLSSFSNVMFITYKSDESLDIHADKHIAVVPTVGSEGTSLSLLEAMSSQCAIISSDVGGMTNIVLDGYNGIMTSAGDDEALYNALKLLLEDKELLNKLANNAYETARQAFSYEKWFAKWTLVLNNYYSN